MNNLLEKICFNKKLEILENKKKCSYKNLEKLLKISKKNKRNLKDKLIKFTDKKQWVDKYLEIYNS